MADPVTADGPPADVAERFGAGKWQFTPEVAEVFGEHVRASVPNYDGIQQLVAECSDWLVPQGGLVADLGCSTGITSAAVGARLKGREARFALYDAEEAMTGRAAEAVGPHAGIRLAVHTRRLEAGPLNHEAADLTLLLFVLQFLPAPGRHQVLRAARMAASETGALIVAEKIRCDDVRWAEIGNDVSHDYKAQAGVTDQAIRAKARALRGVLVPWPAEATFAAIQRAGWTRPEVLFRWHQWMVAGAFASP